MEFFKDSVVLYGNAADLKPVVKVISVGSTNTSPIVQSVVNLGMLL